MEDAGQPARPEGAPDGVVDAVVADPNPHLVVPEDSAEAIAASLPQPKRRGLASAMICVAKTKWQRAKNAILGVARYLQGCCGTRLL
jgi:hypothetical protein